MPISKRVLACQRCRDRKQKCDNGRPRCGHCIRARKECTPQRTNKSWQQSPVDNAELLRRLAFLEEKLEFQSRKGGTEDDAEDDMTMNEMIESADLSGNNGRVSQPPQQEILEAQIRSPTDVPLPPIIALPVQPTPSSSLTTPRWNRRQTTPPPSVAAEIVAAERTSTIAVSVPSPILFRDTSASSTSRGVRDLVGAFASLSSPRDFHGSVRLENTDPYETLSDDNVSVLYETYLSYVHPQYPFLCRRKLDRLFGSHRRTPQSIAAAEHTCRHVRETDSFEKCIIFLVMSIGALIYDGRPRQEPSRSELLYNYAQKHYIPAVLMDKCLISQTTIHLLITMRALHDSSSHAIIHHTSAAVRTAITAGLHRRSQDNSGNSEHISHNEQMMRRVWWCCYGLDRAVAVAFGHPVSIADGFITTGVFHESPTAERNQATNLDAIPYQPGQENEDVSVAYHLTFGRKIQSRIINTFSNPRLDKSTPLGLDRMRSQFCQELEEWQAAIPVPNDKQGYGGREWFRMIAYYSVLGLVLSFHDDLRQAVGAKVVVACCNACISFQQIFRTRQIASSWLALISQFQAGVTILYSFWTTPPPMRTAEFDSSYASRGVRTCSNNLVLLAERWKEAEPYRDVFEILSKAVILDNDPLATMSRRLTPTDLADLERLINKVKQLGAHFQTMDMVEKIFQESQPMTMWTERERGRRSNAQTSHDIPLGFQSYPHVNAPMHYSGRYGESLSLTAGWESGPADGIVGSRSDLYPGMPAYFGLGDPWTDPPNYI